METPVVTFDADSATEALEQLAAVAEDEGYVTEEYRAALLDREDEFPTGIYVPPLDYGVAIPHADAEYASEQAVVVGLPETPVEFGNMEDPADTVAAELVLLLVVSDTDGYSEFLSNLVPLFREESFYEDVRAGNGEALVESITDASP